MTDFATLLRETRKTRRLSQLDLALQANVSSRHISFLETGRARPSRGMVLSLTEVLDVPRAQVNGFLQAGGFAPIRTRRPLDDSLLAPVRQALDWTLKRHAPYPGLILDREWTLVDANTPALRLFEAMGISRGDNLIDRLFSDDLGRAVFDNWEDLSHALAARLRTELSEQGENPRLATLLARVTRALPPREGPSTLPPFIPAVYRMGDMRLSFISTIAQLGSAEDLTLDELRIELLFPTDAETEGFLTRAT